MTAVLAIDAAWTVTEPSGVALVQEGEWGWQCLAVAPSYEEFLAQANGKQTDWAARKFVGSRPNMIKLLESAGELAGDKIDLICVDMPMATVRFASRRAADNAVSRQFGSRWCSTHTPSEDRPGQLGESMSSALRATGFALATVQRPEPARPHLVEVYPHLGLLSLLNRQRRVPYKVSRSNTYWPRSSVRQRIENLMREFREIYAALEDAFGPLGFELPTDASVTHVSRLKRYEDVLDALVCAWIGVKYLGGQAEPLGDATAAIWCPSNVVYGNQTATGRP